MTEEEFASEQQIFELEQLINCEYEMMVVFYGSCQSLDSFVRCAEQDRWYEIGTIFDYHY